MKRDDFKYLDEFPKLVLAIKAYEYKGEFRSYKFKDDDFLPIAHQTAGHGCHQHYMFGKILKHREKWFEPMVKLANKWYDSQVGCFGVSLDELITYRKQIQEWGFDCNYSYIDFEEGIYPIDFHKQVLSTMCYDEFPDELDDLIEFESNFHKTCGIINRWQIFILGENSD